MGNKLQREGGDGNVGERQVRPCGGEGVKAVLAGERQVRPCGGEGGKGRG